MERKFSRYYGKQCRVSATTSFGVKTVVRSRRLPFLCGLLTLSRLAGNPFRPGRGHFHEMSTRQPLDQIGLGSCLYSWKHSTLRRKRRLIEK